MRIALSLFLLLGAAQPVLAQTVPAVPRPPSAEVRAMAAGYKALTVCSAVHNAREAGVTRSLESIEAHELTGIYPELEPLVRTLPVEVTAGGAQVSWDEVMPPRFAVHSAGAGCAILPVGTPEPRAGRPVLRRPDTTAMPTSELRGDRPAIDRLLGEAIGETYGPGSNTTAVVIVQGGRIVAETYADGFGPDVPQRTWSVAKSLAATVVGAAVLRGDADVNAPADITNWQVAGDPRAAITLDHLLRMASGLTSDTAGNRTDALYFGGVTVAEQAPAWPLIARPGSRFRYANNDTLLATLSLAPTYDRHSPHALFDQLGMGHTTAETDWRGHYILSSQVWTTARDLARFGQLYVNDGVWNGRRILPEGWLAYVSRASGPQPLNGAFGYGAGFWLLNRSEGVPGDTIGAFGNRGQYVIIVPSRRIVIVRRAEDPAGSPFDIAAFTRDVLAALDRDA
ncbi:serine hydrolase domain-containing protein [Brevundimonas variabilis]|uniref:CubicO group peptidase (Beta-lactamase class C family) n=1 Tax=Brevundimonas variabilis TaxID=74312 RepID=A0A7W9CHX4_9CAUL|nr:serine hydrolase [Brevundimonas variabilis]MBB5745942.1 CubicO group peptidase (beta-lactamase class C family) [Brevundimonas variabilis]